METLDKDVLSYTKACLCIAVHTLNNALQLIGSAELPRFQFTEKLANYVCSTTNSHSDDILLSEKESCA